MAGEEIVRGQSIALCRGPRSSTPEAQLDEATKQQYEKEIAMAAAQPLPEDDDDDL